MECELNMIIKHNNNLYNLEGWKSVKQEEGYCVISFAKTIKVDDDTYENYEVSFELVNEEYLYDFQREHEDYEYDWKDLRQVRYRADDLIYNIILSEIIRETPFIDLDKLINIPRILNKANKQYEKEWKEDADNYTD